MICICLIVVNVTNVVHNNMNQMDKALSLTNSRITISLKF